MEHAGFDSLGSCSFAPGGGTGLRLRHRASGAEVVTVRNADPERVFGIMFETRPACDNGVAHVLEHLVFRGSERFVQSNLYAGLLQSSRLTGLNASTVADSTLFHLSSAEEEDFANLIDVVLDAVFHPLLRPSDVDEERQVVMNEMAGHHAVPTHVALEGLRRALLPGSVYAVDHGGTPEQIATLRQDDLRAFHAQHYHPGRARLFLWGDVDLAARLAQLDRALGAAGDADALDLRLPAPFAHPRRISLPAPALAPRITATGWAFETEETDLWQALSLGLLADADGPLRRALEARGGRVIGPGFTQDTPLGSFEIALAGHPEMDHSDLSALIRDALRAAPSGGWTETLATRFEYSLRSLGAQGMGPTGLKMLNLIRAAWRHGADPLALLDIDARAARLRHVLRADPESIARRIREDLLDNPHHVTVSLDPQQASRAPSPARPDRPDPDPTHMPPDSPLPFVATGGPPPTVRSIAVEVAQNVLHLTAQPPELSRAELAVSLAGLTAVEIDMVPVLAPLLADRPAQIGLALWTRLWAAPSPRAGGQAFLSVAGKSLPAHGAQLPRQLHAALTAPLPPADAIHRRITAERDRMEAQLAAMGHLFCETRLRAVGSATGALEERLTGVHRLETLNRCVTHAPDSLRETLETLRRRLANGCAMTLAVSGLAPSAEDWRPPPAPSDVPGRLPPLTLAQREDIATGSANFTTGQAVALGDAGPAQVAAHMLETGWLWEALRVAGGAYSVRCSYRSDDGVLSLLCIRDPTPERTLAQIAKAPVWLRAAAQSDLLARCVSAKVGHLRRPVRPDDMLPTALRQHLSGQTEAQRQEELEQVHHVDAKAMTACADRLEDALATARTVVLGPRGGLPDR